MGLMKYSTMNLNSDSVTNVVVIKGIDLRMSALVERIRLGLLGKMIIGLSYELSDMLIEDTIGFEDETKT
jgi:hypothetical protein